MHLSRDVFRSGLDCNFLQFVFGWDFKLHLLLHPIQALDTWLVQNETKLVNLFEIIYFLPNMTLILRQKFKNFLQNQMLPLVEIQNFNSQIVIRLKRKRVDWIFPRMFCSQRKHFCDKSCCITSFFVFIDQKHDSLGKIYSFRIWSIFTWQKFQYSRTG